VPRETLLKDQRSEKQVEHAGDLFMHMLGFSSVRFSQARATQQTPGIPDRRYYRAGAAAQDAPGSNGKLDRPLSLWWEAKRAGGRQSAFQEAFQAMVERHGEVYLCGTDEVLHDWAVEQGLVVRLPNGFKRVR
jgi:hypothetical protein